MLKRKYLSFLHTLILYFLSAFFIPFYTNPKNKRQKPINHKSWLFGAVLYMYWQIFSSIIMAFWSVHEFFFSLLTSSYLPPLSLFADFPPFNYLSICTGIRRNQCLLSVLLVLLFTLNKNIGARSLYINGEVVLLIQQVSFVLTHAFYLSTSQEEEQIICFIFEHWMIFYFKYRRAFW